ncbi:uncharacterized protein LOC114309486 [Camellia sinensis]|uniref:uncharacterized protein LOC114309486 n=1 Tax=Camellia sinensis TaxID=4442 RepID=UPI00103582F8|nr:uncharacterized protein LOC114309486 [Camellia sinensis]
MTTRTALNSVYELIQLLQPLQKEAIKSIGFGGLLELKCTRLPRQLCEWLVGCFDHTSQCLFVHGKRIIITPFDVSHILGLPCEGSIINVNGDHTDIEELSNKYGVKKCGYISLSSLRNELSNMKVDGDDFKRRFVLYILGSLLCPTSELSINRCFLHSLKDMSALHKLNWSKLVLDFLVDGVRKYKDKGEGKGQRGIRGCLFFLMLFYVEHVTPAVDFVSPCASRQAPRLVYWIDEVIKKRISMLEKLQYQNNKKVGFIVEDNDVSVEPNMNARLSNVEKEVKDLRGDLNNLVVGVSQSIESAKEEILIAIAKVANGLWAIEKEKHYHDIDCQLKNEDILDDKWSPPPYAFQDRNFPMDKQLKQQNEGLPKTPLCDQFTSSVSPFAPFFSEHELLPPKLPKVILKRSIPVDDDAESSTVLPYHMKLRRESKRKKSKHILSPYDVELGKDLN